MGLDTYNRESELAVTLRSQTSSDDPEIRAALELTDHSRAILTPHNAFNTLEAVDRKADHTIRQITHFLQHHRFLWPIPE